MKVCSARQVWSLLSLIFAHIATEVRTILVLGYWLLGDIHRYWIVLLLADIFHCDNQYDTNQTAVGTVHKNATERLFSSACDLYSDSHNRLSGHRADMLLFIKHNHRHHHHHHHHHHHTVLRLYMV